MKVTLKIINNLLQIRKEAKGKYEDFCHHAQWGLKGAKVKAIHHESGKSESQE